jgi:peptide chain release factor subunit 1
MKEAYERLREIKRLKTVRGSGTQLISVYIPAGYQLSEEVSRLKNEYSTSGNIKSNTTRANVLSAIDKIIQYLKLFRETPKNGLVVFSGNVSNDPSKIEIELFSMEPPEPLKVNIYRCDSTFLLEPIEDMMDTKDTYALVVMDGREATVATLKGAHTHVVKKIHSMAHAKMKKGGQSSGRFSRARDEDIAQYRTQIGEAVNALFIQQQFQIKGLIVGGPGPAKEDFVKAQKLNYQIKVLGVFDTGYTDETGLNELLEKAGEVLKEQEAAQERKVLEKFMKEISSGGLAVYGYERTKEALAKNQVNTLIINKDLELYTVKYKCSVCNQIIEKLAKGEERESKHEADGGSLSIVEAKDAIEALLEVADKNGVETVFVSHESPLGKEFEMGFQGIAAILRYR